MNTACIVVLTIAIGAGGIAAYLASGFDHQFAAPAAPIAQLRTTLQRQIRSVMTVNSHIIKPRDASVSAVARGIAPRPAVQT